MSSGIADIAPTSATSTGGVKVRPLSGYTGAEISGVDIAAGPSPEQVEQIRNALLDWKVVFFREQHLTPAQHVSFTRHFGEVNPALSPIPVTGIEGYPEILLLTRSNSAPDPGDTVWHTDMSFLQQPPMGSILRALQVPPYGGDTWWTNLHAVYQGLSQPIRELLDKLQAVHRNPFGSEATIHPVIQIHPESGQPAVWVNPNFTSHIVGLSNHESARLLSFLFERIALPAYTVRFRWEPGSIAFWDNRSAAHLIPGDLRGHAEGERTMHRTTLAGHLPGGPDGFRSRPVADATDSAGLSSQLTALQRDLHRST